MLSRGLLLASVLALAACGGGGPAAPSAAGPSPTPAPQPSVGPSVLRTATFNGAHGHSASGTARIVQVGSEYSLQLLEDFRVDTGSIDVYLARGQNTVDMSRDLNLGNMVARTGAQTYAMPNAGSAYPYVLLWCRPFRVPIGVGELR